MKGIVSSNPVQDQFVASYKIDGVSKTTAFSSKRYITANQVVDITVTGNNAAVIDDTQFPVRMPRYAVNSWKFYYSSLR